MDGTNKGRLAGSRVRGWRQAHYLGVAILAPEMPGSPSPARKPSGESHSSQVSLWVATFQLSHCSAPSCMDLMVPDMQEFPKQK